MMKKAEKLIGNCRLNQCMCSVGLTKDVTCRFCQDKENTVKHILYVYDGLIILIFKYKQGKLGSRNQIYKVYLRGNN